MRQRAIAIGVGVVLGFTVAGAQSRYEAPAVLRAADVAPAELLQSKVYRIDDKVPTDGLVTKTTFHAPFGEFVAEGPGMVAVRAAEIQALDVLSKTETSEIFQKAMAASMKRTRQSLKTAVTHPVETVKGIPAGVGRFFDRVSRDVKTGMQKVGDTKGSGGAESGSSTIEEVKEGATMAGQSVIGYNDARRRLAKYLGVDPYTRNKVLADKLDSAAWAVWGGEFGPDTVIGFVPGGFAIKFTRDWVSDLVWDMTPGDLRVRMETHLKSLGVAQDPIDRFLRQPSFTQSSRRTRSTLGHDHQGDRAANAGNPVQLDTVGGCDGLTRNAHTVRPPGLPLRHAAAAPRGLLAARVAPLGLGPAVEGTPRRVVDTALARVRGEVALDRVDRVVGGGTSPPRALDETTACALVPRASFLPDREQRDVDDLDAFLARRNVYGSALLGTLDV
jgi:hypothetical protein